MVVLVLMGIITSMMTISVGDGGKFRELEEEAQRLKTLLEMAKDETIMRSQDWTIAILENGYQFELERIEDDKGTRKRKRHPIEDKIFRQRQLEGYRLNLIFDDSSSFTEEQIPDELKTENEEDIIGRVSIYASGEMSENFEITMEQENGEDKFILTGDQLGQLKLKSSRDEDI